ncbi:hypothetical protein N9Y42_08325 [Mariniblastus sp.]|nr:hypothetical protein [Mariniblastus sp.]
MVRIKQPYIDWAMTLDDSGVLPDLIGEPSMYLLPECLNEAEAFEKLSHGYETIFEAELFAWYTEPTSWPANRSFAVFQDWFELTFVSLIHDLCEGPILDDDVQEAD